MSPGTCAPARAKAPAGGGLAVPRVLPVRSLSVSSMQLFERCPAQWRARYVDGLRSPPSLKMAAGKAFGAAMAHYFAARIAGEGAPGVLELDDRMLAEFDLELPLARVGAEESPEAVRESCRRPLAVYARGVAPALRPLAVERRATLRFPGAEWSFVGYLDLELEGGEVVDYKLGARHVDSATVRRDAQASAYTLARLLEGEPRPRFSFHSGRRGRVRSGPRWKRLAAERTPEQLRGFQRRLALVARSIARCAEGDEWPLGPHGWWCGQSTCAVWGRCPAGGLR